MRTIGYVRVSTEEQAASGLGLANQEEKIRACALSKSWSIDHVYRDEGYSASSLSRPGVREMLDEVRGRKVERIIIYSLDRLTRSLLDLLATLKLFKKSEVTLISVNDSLDTSTAGGRMITNIFGVVAEWEREIISERVSAANAIKRRRGQKMGGLVPFGCLVKVEGKKKMLIPDPETAPVLAEILGLESQGVYRSEIARRLNARGIPGAAGGRWQATTVSRVITRARALQAAPEAPGASPA